MTFAKDLPTLINDLDMILAQSKDYHTWSKPENFEHQRRILQKTRNYLLSLGQITPDHPSNLTSIEQETAKQIAQAVIDQINSRGSDWVQSAQTELTTLHQQREALLREVRQLQEQRQKMVSDLLKMLLDRFQQIVTQKMTETWHHLETQFLHSQSLRQSEVSPVSHPSSDLPPLEVSYYIDYLEHLRQFQQQSEQRLMTLDGTFESVFETLQSNVQAYVKSLSDGLERMHNLGQQSEVMLTNYVQKISQQVGEPLTISPPIAAPIPEEKPLPKSEILPEENDQPPFPSATENYPFPGLEIPAPHPIVTPDSQEIEPKQTTETIAFDQSPLDILLDLDLRQETALTEALAVNSQEETKLLSYPGLFDLDLDNTPSQEQIEGTVEPINPSWISGLEELAQTYDFDVEITLFGENPDLPNESISTPIIEVIPEQSEIIPQNLLYPPEPQLLPVSSSITATIPSEPVTVSAPPSPPISSDNSQELINTINLLTDLLKQGALDRTDQEENEGQNPNLTREESLLPNQGQKAKEPDLDEVLVPTTLEQLSRDLQFFESEQR